MAAQPHPSSVTPALLAAYRATHYCVRGVAQPFLLRVDEPSADLEACHRAHGVSCSAFLTAWNPGSRALPEEDNRAAQLRLSALLAERGFALLAGLGVDPTGQWEGEESLLVLGVERAEAIGIGRAFGQNGILYSGADAVPRLVLLA
jgi:hypothetical protein